MPEYSHHHCRNDSVLHKSRKQFLNTCNMLPISTMESPFLMNIFTGSTGTLTLSRRNTATFWIYVYAIFLNAFHLLRNGQAAIGVNVANYTQKPNCECKNISGCKVFFNLLLRRTEVLNHLILDDILCSDYIEIMLFSHNFFIPAGQVLHWSSLLTKSILGAEGQYWYLLITRLWYEIM